MAASAHLIVRRTFMLIQCNTIHGNAMRKIPLRAEGWPAAGVVFCVKNLLPKRPASPHPIGQRPAFYTFDIA